MLKELDVITLTDHIPLDCIWDIPPGSPLFDTGSREAGLRPGDVGMVVYVQGNGEAFEVGVPEAGWSHSSHRHRPAFAGAPRYRRGSCQRPLLDEAGPPLPVINRSLDAVACLGGPGL